MINYPSIVKYINSEIVNNNELYVYLEYMPCSLKKIINDSADGVLEEKVIKKYCREILQALTYLHCKGIVHRDIKTENILIDNNGQIRLSDFSCSSILSRDNKDEGINQMEQSEFLESIKGTILWMAPEVINQKKYGRKADIWSFGCTVLEMLTGKNPWSNLQIDNYIQALYQIGKSELNPDYPETISEDLKNFLDCCLTRNYKERANTKDLLSHPFLKEY